ncbi:EamA family transporter [Halobellus sp. GM3]|uniref:EamA family transporter n=1 Tax=Halobellus sp. GM3 TaxID=3458410 RepID=UPI00403DA183
MIAVSHLGAIVIAVAAAMSNAASQLWIRLGTSEGEAFDGVLVVMITNLVVLIPVVGVLYFPNYGLTRDSLVMFVAAGLVGTMLGRVFMYTSIDRIGASRTSPIVATQAIVASGLGILILGENVTVPHGVGVAFIVLGVAALSWETTQENPDDLSRRELLIGLLLPFGAAFAYGFEPIFATSGLREGTPAPVGLALKTFAATVGFLTYLRWKSALPSFGTIWSINTRWFVFAGVGNSLFLLGYYLALELAPVSVVVPIVMTYTLFVVVFSAVFMPRRLERITWRLAGATVVIVAGALVVTMFG